MTTNENHNIFKMFVRMTFDVKCPAMKQITASSTVYTKSGKPAPKSINAPAKTPNPIAAISLSKKAMDNAMIKTRFGFIAKPFTFPIGACCNEKNKTISIV